MKTSENPQLSTLNSPLSTLNSQLLTFNSQLSTLNSPLVPPGYKQTEVGVIPEDWNVAALETVAKITDPQPDHRTPPEVTGGEPYIGISDFLDERTVNWDDSRKIISKAVDKQQSSFRLQSGDIIFGKIGTIGSPRFVPIAPFRYALSANVLLIQPTIEPNFVMSWLRSKPCERAVISKLHSTSQAAFGINKMRRVLIPLPPLPEQEAIAEALSDADALIESLEQLLTKKHHLKQGAMQWLLTPPVSTQVDNGKLKIDSEENSPFSTIHSPLNKRLSGFSGEWEMKRLGDVAALYQPLTISANQFTASGYPVYGANGIVGFFDKFNHETWQVTVTCRGSTCGTVNRTVEKCWITGNAMVINCDNSKQVDKTFLYYLLTSQDLSICITGTGQPQIVRAPLANFDLRIPTTIEEQTAIAAILSDMDAEIAALETKLTKTRQLKQGMMQELLTGKTRLVDSGKLKVENEG